MSDAGAKVESPRVTLMLVCVGIDRGKSATRVNVWRKVTREEYAGGTDPSDKPILSYARAKRGQKSSMLDRARVGQVFTVEGADEDGTTIYPSTARYVGLWPATAADGWRIRADAYAARLDLEDRAAKDGKVDPLLVGLEPLKREYHRIPEFERSYLLARVVAYITRGPWNRKELP